MAQITRVRPDGDRGQMILLMGVVLAVMFVALAILVNAAIYTDNVATRGGDPAGEALEYQNGVVDSTEGLMEAENDAGNATAADVRPALRNISDYHRRYHLRRGAATNTTFDIYEGKNITQTGADEFRNWHYNADDIRAFNINISGETMEGNKSLSVILPGDNNNISVNETNNKIYVNDTSGVVYCKVPTSDSIKFNVTAAELGDQSCSFNTTSFDDGGNIGFEKGENGAGGYTVLFESGTDVSNPSITSEFIYRLKLELYIITSNLRYERRVELVSEMGVAWEDINA